MTNKEYMAVIKAERELLMKRMGTHDEIRPSWTRFKRRGNRVRLKLLRYLDRTTTGRFVAGKKYIAFEEEADAVMYRIAYPQ